MYLEYILNEEFENSYSSKDKAQESPSSYLPMALDTVTLDAPLKISLSPQSSDDPKIKVRTEGTLPANFNFSFDRAKPSGYIILHTSAKQLKGKYGTLTSALRVTGSDNAPSSFTGEYDITRTYKNEPVEFIDPSLHAIYSKPFRDPSNTEQFSVFIGLRFEASMSKNPNKTDTVIYQCHELVLLPYSLQSIDEVLSRTQTQDAIHKVAKNLRKNLVKI